MWFIFIYLFLRQQEALGVFLPGRRNAVSFLHPSLQNLFPSHSSSLSVTSPPPSLCQTRHHPLTAVFPHKPWYSQMSPDTSSSRYFLHSPFLSFAAAKALVHAVAPFQLDTATSRFPTSSLLPPTFCSQAAQPLPKPRIFCFPF